MGGEALCRADAEFPDLGKVIFADTVRAGSISAVSARALYNLGGAADVQTVVSHSLILGVGMLPEEEMWICGPSQGQHVNNTMSHRPSLTKDRCNFCPAQKSICAIP